jgi:hypothetical protein
MNDKKDSIKKNLKDILKVSSKIKPLKRTPQKIKQKEQFCEMLNAFKYVNDRAVLMKTEIGVDFILYEDPFFTIIESLLEIAYNKKQQALINWWIYEKWDHPEGVLILTNQDTGEEIPTDTAEELYELLQII